MIYYIVKYQIIFKSQKVVNKVFTLNQIIKTKKPHPCGCNEWTIIRVGADFKIECNQCKRVVLVDSTKLNKMVKK